MDLFPREHSEAAWLFNCGRYFDAHERWESLWLKESPGPRRIFYQMLIHAAVCLHHWARGNRMGLVLQWRQFDRKAETFSGGAHWGVHVAALRRDLSILIGPIAADGGYALPPFDRDLRPELVLTGLEPKPVDGPSQP